ncbi:MAG: BON domain-containing protein [Planctomycetales bacterium]|nr:BON domain-containing protein [Planctomycetales bacterium]
MPARLLTVALLFAGTWVFLPTDASAQNRNNQSSTNSLFGSSGSSSFSTARSAAASGIGGASSQLGGRSAAGGLASGSGAQGANAQDSFVGRTEADVTNFFNQLNPLARMGNLGGQNRGALNRGRDVNSTQDVRPPLRVKVHVGFDAPAAPAAAQSPVAQGRLNSILQTHGMPDARVSMQDGVAVLSGRVNSAHEAKLLARIVRLEPGVVRVIDRTENPDELPAPPELP